MRDLEDNRRRRDDDDDDDFKSRSRRRRSRRDDDDDDDDDEDDAEPSGFVASNPAKVQCELRRYFRCYPLWPCVWLFTTIAFGVVSALYSLWFLIGVACFFLVFFLWRLASQNHLESGDLCPAIVLDEARGLIAVYTNMANDGVSEHPFLSLVVVPLARASQEYHDDDRLPVACMYNTTPENKDRSRWGAIDVIPIACATSNERAIRKALRSIAAEDWDALELALRKLKDEDEPGNFYINEYDDDGRRKTGKTRKPKKPRRRDDSDD